MNLAALALIAIQAWNFTDHRGVPSQLTLLDDPAIAGDEILTIKTQDGDIHEMPYVSVEGDRFVSGYTDLYPGGEIHESPIIELVTGESFQKLQVELADPSTQAMYFNVTAPCSARADAFLIVSDYQALKSWGYCLERQ